MKNRPLVALVVDSRDPRPAYRQIADQVTYRVSTGDLRPGDPLPSVREVAVELGVNQNTVARAYRILAEAGILDVSHGRRARVAQGADRPRPAAKGREEAVREGIRRLRAEAFRLGIPADRLARLLKDEMEDGS